jgi:hypothetical protein
MWCRENKGKKACDCNLLKVKLWLRDRCCYTSCEASPNGGAWYCKEESFVDMSQVMRSVLHETITC